MAKDPAVLFYTQDFLTGTSLMTAEEVGCYIRLLCYQQQYGSLSEAALKKILNGSFERVWPVIAEKFEQDQDGSFFNARMRSEIARRKKQSEKQKENANRRWDKSGICHGNATAMPLETETEIETKDLRKGAENHQRGNLESHPIAGEITYDAEKTILESVIEFERICMVSRVTEEVARDSLHTYHLHLIEKEQYPRGRKSVFAGFEKWLRNEKKFTNGTVKKSSSGGRGQAGINHAISDLQRDIQTTAARTRDA